MPISGYMYCNRGESYLLILSNYATRNTKIVILLVIQTVEGFTDDLSERRKICDNDTKVLERGSYLGAYLLEDGIS